jgi:hypothetical protein
MPEINNGPLPEELKGWNWGAFLLSWIWAIGHNVWIGLIALFGPASLVMSIILGIKGNEWAWQYRQFKSLDEFKEIQKAWTKWGIIVAVAQLVLGIMFMILYAVIFVAAMNQGNGSMFSN